MAREARQRRAAGAAALAALTVGLLLTALAWWFVRTAVTGEADLRFAEAVDDIEAELRDQLLAAATITQDVPAFLVDRPVPSAADWDRRLGQVGVAERFPAIRAMNFARAVAPGELAAWEAANGVEVFPSREQADVHAVIEVVHPLSTNAGARGLDLLGRPGAAGAVRQAAATGDATASDVLVLVQDDDEAAGFVIYDAVYDGTPTTTDERSDALRGWVGAAFRAQDLIDALDLNTRLVAFELRDVETAEPDVRLLLARGGQWRDDVARREVRGLSVLGQQWEVEFRRAGPLVGPIEAWAPLLTLALGGLTTLAAASYVLALRRAQLRAVAGEADAVARLEVANDALARTNERLEQRNAAVVESNAELERTNAALAGANAELEDANDALVVANEVKDDFLAVVSHEFRTPLTVIRGFATTVLQSHGETLAPRVRDALERIDRNADRLNLLVDDLLVAARIERGVVTPSPVALDVAHLCVEVVEELRWGDDAIELRTAPCRAAADPEHVRRILENLLGNAAKYGAPPVVVRTDVEGTAAVLSVRDHGGGVPAELSERLFTAFTQGESGPARRGKGVGLGLAIARQLAELNAGSLVLEPCEPGARFVLRLPTAAAVGAARLRDGAAAG